MHIINTPNFSLSMASRLSCMARQVMACNNMPRSEVCLYTSPRDTVSKKSPRNSYASARKKKVARKFNQTSTIS